jgi:glycosyltransferase involved in cell wall biosynthesis
VSVIIPTYNRKDLLRLTLESVLAQTYPAIEIIVVDDCSTDGTYQMLEEYRDRITLIRHAVNGESNGRNTGIDVARGQFLNFLDHDDLMLPTKIERQMAMMKAHPEFGLVHCGFYHIDKEGNCIKAFTNLPEGDVRRELVQDCFLWSGAPLIRRECIKQVGGFDGTVWCEDYEMWLRIALAGYRFGCIQEPLGAYRILLDSAMSNLSKLETSVLLVLKRTFADPRLSAEALPMKQRSFFNHHFWFACRYYLAKRIEDAERNLLEALSLRPALFKDNKELAYLFYDSALDPWVPEPVNYIIDLFDNLPVSIRNVVESQRPWAIGKVCFDLAMRCYAKGNYAEAKTYLTQAIEQDPMIIQNKDRFASELVENARRLPVIPLDFINTVFQNLPASALGLVRYRNKIETDFHIDCVFQDYDSGHLSSIPKQVMTCIQKKPSLLKNRGVIAILAKSLPYIFQEDNFIPTYLRTNMPFRLPSESSRIF